MNPLVQAMLQPAFYPHRPARVELVQTHISWVFLAGDMVFKVKKPVRFSFLDFSSLEHRRHFCHEEVRLNAALAEGVYVGVAAICRDGRGLHLSSPSDPQAIEYAVQMHRLADGSRLDQVLQQRGEAAGWIDAIALRLADFHAAAASSPEITANGSVAAVQAILEDNYANVARFRGVTIDPFDDDAIQNFARRFLRLESSLFAARQRAGRIREGHGDLRTDHVYVGEPLRIVDRIEFNERFRYCDVASDIAFLAMDLDFLARSDLSQRLVQKYIALSSDTALARLLPFYACYRAYVRGKVDSLKTQEAEVDAAEREAAAVAAAQHFELSYRYTWAGAPLLLVVSGLSGSGKSMLSARIAQRCGFVHLNSDVTRKALFGIEPTARVLAPQRHRLYSSAHSQRTYAALSAAARTALRAGRGVIVDATFQRRSDRDEMRALAAEAKVAVVFADCVSDPDVIASRLQARTARDDSASDADWQIYLRQRRAFEAYSADEDPIEVDTRRDVTANARSVETQLRSAATR